MKHIDDIESIVKDFCLAKKSAVRTTAELDDRVIDSALQAQPKSKSRQSAVLRPDMWRIIMRSRMTKLTAAAVLVLVIILGIIDLGEPRGGAGAAFAAAMNSVRQARTFSCIRISETWYDAGKEKGTYLLKQKRMFKEPDWERHEQLTSAPPWPQDVGKVTIWHYGKRQRLEFRPFDKTAQFHDMSSDYVIDEATGELKLKQLDTRIREYVLEISAGAVEDLGRVKLDWRSVRMLRSRKDKRITTVWVDPKTDYPVQIEHKWTDQSRLPLTFASIQIDAELDDRLFSLEPPEGYTLSVREPGMPDYKMKMMTKLKHLGLWCVIYANDNDDRFPEKLADLTSFGIVTQQKLNTLLAAPDDPDGPPAIRYRKPNTASGRNWATEVTVYEMYDQWPEDGVVACFADGHCELIANQNRFEELLK